MSARAEARRPAWFGSAPVFVAGAVLGGLLVAVAVTAVADSPKLGLVALVGLAVLLLAVQRLSFGLAVLVALTYTHGFVVVNEHGVPSAAFPFAVLLVVLAFVARGLDEPFLPRSAEPAVAAFAAYGAWLVGSAAWAADADASLRAAGAYAKLVVMVIAVLALVRTPRRLVVVTWAVVGSAAILAGMTVLQHFSDGLTFFGFAKPPVHELTSTGEAIRAVGPIGNPNAYAQLLVIATPFAFGRMLVERRTELRALAACTILLCAVAVYLTDSRGGFVGLATVLGLSFLRYRARVALLVFGAAIVLLLAGSLSGSYSSRLETLPQALPWHSDSQSSDPSIQGRAIFLHAGYHMWRDHPLGGVGYANFGVSYKGYNRGVGADPTLGSSAHNTPLEVLTETGVIGLALWCILILTAFTSLWRVRAWAGAARSDVSLTVDYLAIALIGYLVTSLFLGGAYASHAWLLFAICCSVRGALGDGVRPVRGRLRVPAPAR